MRILSALNRIRCVPALFALLVLVGSLPAASQQFHTLTSFSGPNGTGPDSLLQAIDGNLYGTTSAGGANGKGTFFRFTPAGVLTVLHDFTAADGVGANSSLLQAGDGNLYGIIAHTVFKMDLTGQVTFLYTFTPPTNSFRSAMLPTLILAWDGNLYGLTWAQYNTVDGLNNVYLNLTNTLFKIDMAGNRTAAYYGGYHLHLTPELGRPSLPIFTGALIQADDGNFYGTRSGGRIFLTSISPSMVKIDPEAHVLTTLYPFGLGSPVGFIQAVDGDFYGTTGGANGTIFHITSAGTLTILHTFSDLDGNGHNPDGANPSTSLFQAGDGNLYGTTSKGGANGDGTIFQITPSGVFTDLHDFTGTDGSAPYTLLQAQDGKLYGTTGGGKGTIFALDLGLPTGSRLTGLTPAQTTVAVGGYITAHVKLQYPTPSANLQVSLTSSNPAVAQPVDSNNNPITQVHVASGSALAFFRVAGLKASAAPVTITATLGGISRSFVLAVGTSNTLLQTANAVGTVGQDVTLRALLRSKFDGSRLAGRSVDFLLNGVPVDTATTDASGMAYLTYTVPDDLGSNALSLTADFAGDDAYNAGTSTASTLTVKPAGTYPFAPNAAAAIGQTVALKVLLRSIPDASPIVGRSVVFSVGGVSVGSATTGDDGIATLNRQVSEGAGAGTRSLSAAFAGDTAYQAATANATLTAQKGSIYLTVGTAGGKVGQTVLLRALLRRIPDALTLSGRTVTFSMDGAAVGTGVSGSNGLASVNYTIPKGTAAGSHTITAAFAGDAAYNAVSGTNTLTVKP